MSAITEKNNETGAKPEKLVTEGPLSEKDEQGEAIERQQEQAKLALADQENSKEVSDQQKQSLANIQSKLQEIEKFRDQIEAMYATENSAPERVPAS